MLLKQPPGHHTDERFETRILDYRFAPDVAHCWASNPFLTQWYNAISAGIPGCERLVCEMIRYYLPNIKDEKQKQLMKDLIRQEAHHTSTHLAYNKALEKRGYNLFDKYNLGFAKINKIVFGWWLPMHGLLAAAATTEHVFASIADATFRYQLLDHAEVNFKTHWETHLVEEIEHKAVTYDTYQQLKFSYLVRLIGMLITYSQLIPMFAFRHLYFLYKEKQLFNAKVWYQGLKQAFIKPGYFFKIAWDLLKFAKPNFHPWQEKNQEYLKVWEQKYADKILQRK